MARLILIWHFDQEKNLASIWTKNDLAINQKTTR